MEGEIVVKEETYLGRLGFLFGTLIDSVAVLNGCGRIVCHTRRGDIY